MAWVVSNDVTDSAATASFAVTEPAHLADDVLFYVITQDGGATTIATTDADWTFLAGQTAASGSRTVVAWKVGTGTTYKEPIEASIVANASSNVWINSQSGWAVVNDLSIDGSAQTEFTADYTDDEVDITVAANFAGTEMQAWWAYNLTTEQGISDFFGGVTLADGSFLIHNAVVDINLDNTTTTNIHETVNVKFFRDDAAYPVKSGGATSGGGGIDVKWRDPIYTKNVGGSALTAPESAKLLGLPSATNIVDEWETQSQADPTGFHVNAKEINGVSIQGAGTEADPLRAVGVDP